MRHWLLPTAVLTVVLAAGCQPAPDTAGTAPHRSSRPTGTPAAGPTGADLIVGHTLYTAAGRRVPLPGGATVLDARNLADGGWLVDTTGPHDAQRLWRIAADGHATALTNHNAVADRSGRHVVWASGTHELTAATVGPDGLSDKRTSHIDLGPSTPIWVVPEAVLDSGAVVLAGSAGAGPVGFDVWNPAGGAYHRSVNAVRSVFAVTADGAHVVGLVGASGQARRGLAVLDPARNFAAGRQMSPADLQAIDGDAVSPADLALATSSGGLAAYQLNSGAPRPAGTWRLGSPFDAVWVDDHTALVTHGADGGSERVLLARLDTRHPGVVTPVALPAGAHGDPVLVIPAPR